MRKRIAKLLAIWKLWRHGTYVNKHGITVQYVKQPVTSLFTGRKYFKLTRYAQKAGYVWSRTRPGVVINPMKKMKRLQRRFNRFMRRHNATA